jgi:hypothetical protein
MVGTIVVGAHPALSQLDGFGMLLCGAPFVNASSLCCRHEIVSGLRCIGWFLSLRRSSAAHT